MARPSYPTLSSRALNRATLARQLLLERASGLDPVSALEQIGGVQAQEPASPFLALWTRLADFDPRTLRAAFERREVVKATLMRITLHAVSATDYRALLPALLPMFRASGAFRRGTPRPEGVAELAADERLRHALGHAAQLDVHARFSATSVVERVEQVYRQLLAPDAA